MGLHIVLHEPEIPQNTGNIARTCVATGARLHLIHPLGFKITEKAVRRAGMDYWQRLQLSEWQSIEQFFNAVGSLDGDLLMPSQKPRVPGQCHFVSTKAKHAFSSLTYPERCFFLFGKESAGLPEHYMNNYPEQSITIPMTEGNRSLNLSNAVAIIAYEYLRQQNFTFSPAEELHAPGQIVPSEGV